MFSTSFLKLGLALLPIVAAKVIDIRVGDGGLKYSPEAIGAAVGDQVVFHFIAKNHTVTQSSFADPCGRAEGGFDSGFMPVAEGYAPPTFTVDVKDTKPIWVYCRQAGKTANSHCGAGMVFAINCGLDHEPNSFGNFKKAALAIGEKLKAEAAASATPSSGGGYGGGGYGGGADSAATPTAAETAPYGGYTLPPVAGPVVVVTKEVTLGDAKWTTTYSSYPGSADPTPAAAEGVNHKVVVGGASGLIFDPPRVDAKPRDTVTFEFRQKNHTVTQSSFSDPCRKLDNGFDTGFFPVAADFTGEFPTWTVTVNDTQPIWAYCKQRTPASHCGAGMVFSINSVESSQRNFAAFQNVAKAINGTAAAQESAPAPTSTGAATNNNAGVASFPMTGAALTIVFGALFSLL